MYDRSMGKSSNAPMREMAFLTGETNGSVTATQNTIAFDSSAEKNPKSTLAKSTHIRRPINPETVVARI